MFGRLDLVAPPDRKRKWSRTYSTNMVPGATWPAFPRASGAHSHLAVAPRCAAHAEGPQLAGARRRRLHKPFRARMTRHTSEVPQLDVPCIIMPLSQTYQMVTYRERERGTRIVVHTVCARVLTLV